MQIVRDQLQAFFKGTVQDDRCAALMQTALKNAADGPPSRHTGRPPSSGQSSNVSETNIVDNATVVLPTLALLPEWAIQHFAARRMHLLDSPMDGNCLFYAFCILHGLCPDDAHADLRKKCVAFVAANWQHYKTAMPSLMTFDTPEAYVASMEKPGTPAIAIEIDAFANIIDEPESQCHPAMQEQRYQCRLHGPAMVCSTPFPTCPPDST